MYIKDRARVHGLVIIETNKIFTLYVIISGHANITIIIAKTCPRIVVIQTYQKLLFAARCPMTRKIFAQSAVYRWIRIAFEIRIIIITVCAIKNEKAGERRIKGCVTSASFDDIIIKSYMVECVYELRLLNQKFHAH